jgi:hypothetical protein
MLASIFESDRMAKERTTREGLQRLIFSELTKRFTNPRVAIRVYRVQPDGWDANVMDGSAEINDAMLGIVKVLQDRYDLVQ